MSWTIELELNTDIQQFEAWLDEYLSRPGYPRFRNENGDEIRVVKKQTLVSGNQVRRRHVIEACIVEILPSGNEFVGFGPTHYFPVIELHLFKRADNRLIVNIACEHPALTPYVEAMLDEIARMWPEDHTKKGGTSEDKPLLGAEEIPHPKKQRRDAQLRAALALAALATGKCATRTNAAKWAYTSTITINKYENHQFVKDQVERFVHNPDERKKVRNDFAQRSINRRKSKDL